MNLKAAQRASGVPHLGGARFVEPTQRRSLRPPGYPFCRRTGSLIRLALLAAAILSGVPARVSAQYSGPLRRQVVLGDLTGRTDYREARILTRQGVLPVTGSGDGKPFSILNFSSRQIVLQFNPSAGLSSLNPNTVKITFFDTERALISALILDEVDAAELESETSAMEVRKSNPHILPLPIPMAPNTVKLIAYNHRRRPFASAGIRQAISYGINHDYIVKKIIRDGKANIARGPFDSDSPLYNPGMNSYKYKPRDALRMLWQRGWRDTNKDGVLDKNGVPFVMELIYQKGARLDEAISRIVKIDLIKLGIDVHPRPLTRQQINDRLATADFDAILLDHVFADNAGSLKDFFSAHGKQNYMGYKSPVLERYVRFFENSRSKARRKTLIKSMQKVINQDQPVTFLYFKWLTHYLVNIERFENFRYTEGPSRGKIRPFEEWRLRTQGQPWPE